MTWDGIFSGMAETAEWAELESSLAESAVFIYVTVSS